jgi:hypothetical protein
LGRRVSFSTSLRLRLRFRPSHCLHPPCCPCPNLTTVLRPVYLSSPLRSGSSNGGPRHGLQARNVPLEM